MPHAMSQRTAAPGVRWNSGRRSFFYGTQVKGGCLHWRACPRRPLGGSCRSSSNPEEWEEANSTDLPTEMTPQGNLTNTRDTENERTNLQAQ